MKRLVAMVALLLAAPGWVSAQNENHPPQGLGYVFVGGATHGMHLTTGFGGEGYLYKGVALGVEAGAIGLTGGTSYYGGASNATGEASADVSYHYFPRQTTNQVAPFVAGGYTLLFGHNASLVGKDVTTNGFNVGGGVDVFGTRRWGVRIDVRYYGHGGRIFKNIYPSIAQFSFVAFRVGVTFR